MSNDNIETNPEINDNLGDAVEQSAPEAKAEPLKVNPVIIQSDKVAINSGYTIVLSGDMEKDLLEKVYGEGLAKEDMDAQLAYLIAGETLNADSLLYANLDMTTKSNIIHGMDSEGTSRKTAMTKPKPKLGGKLIGEDAVLQITSLMGVGGLLEVPLVNSGFRISLKKLDGDTAIALDEQLLLNKGEFGRLTMGASMSFANVYLQKDIVNTALRLVRSNNLDFVNDGDMEQMRKLIDEKDYPTIVTALLASSNPDGFDVNVVCTSDDKNCHAVTTGKANAARMMIVDHGMLTDKQLEVITRPLGTSISKDELDAYRDDFKYDNDSHEFDVEVNGEKMKYRFLFQSPSLDTHIRAGIEWAMGINRTIQNYLAQTDDSTARKRLLKKQLQLNTLAQFGGWIKELQIMDETGDVVATVEDTKTIIDTLKAVYMVEGVMDVVEAVRKFIFASNPVTIGIPPMECPSCKKPLSTTNDVVPLDVEKLFFIHSIDPELMRRHYGLLELMQ